ncbi:hypothetical protein LCGC14_3129060 [marine sediment metagenome]|uniref:Uncharacterized protein n=1 Tax=marine sediment metagenome TaxID=412755 RepID=A0A0F8W0A4_9ZZZZ
MSILKAFWRRIRPRRRIQPIRLDCFCEHAVDLPQGELGPIPPEVIADYLEGLDNVTLSKRGEWVKTPGSNQ